MITKVELKNEEKVVESYQEKSTIECFFIITSTTRIKKIGKKNSFKDQSS